jgi:fatty-acyl-CoA synthase
MNTATKMTGRNSAAKAWLRALEKTALIARQRERVFPVLIDELAAQFGDATALLSESEQLSYQDLSGRSNQYARWALEHRIAKGDVVCLMMPNRPEFLVVWLGVTKVGGVVALLNTNLTGQALAHCIRVVEPRHIIADSAFGETIAAAVPDFWPNRIHTAGAASYSTQELSSSERRPVSIEDRALYIYTSGTTGLPKAANVSHARVMQWGRWFQGMLDLEASDRLYNCLPMYHSVGGVLAPGAILAAGGSLVIAEKFSASRFWSDVVRWDCTLIQYIGELCRYLVNTSASEFDTLHRVRMACGNGLRPDVWEKFQSRFRIPRIFEFYAATEGGLSLFNVEGKCGAIGRVPGYLAHRYAPTLVRFDHETGAPARDRNGFCVRCGVDEAGEAIVRMTDDSSNPGGRFEGYTNQEASEKRIVRDVFSPGDSWVRTGDLMRRDEAGYFYFVDRIGDTFRWKGENVATLEVEEAICAFPGVEQANVYGVEIAGADGRAAMAALVVRENFDIAAFGDHLVSCLPSYARPLFLRIQSEIETTGTYKQTKNGLARQGFNPSDTPDVLYFNQADQSAYVRLDRSLFDRIQAGEVRI